jgi:hypothetical protein
VIATAIVATVSDASAFTSGRHLAAWLGLVPKQNATGGRQALGRISKRGDSYLRRLLINGAQSVLRWAKKGKSSTWLIDLLERRPRSVVAIALTNKMARIVWAMLRRGEDYRKEAIASAREAVGPPQQRRGERTLARDESVMAKRSHQEPAHPAVGQRATQPATLIGSRLAESIRASGDVTASTGRTHDREQPSRQRDQNLLASRGPSTHDP